MKKVLSIFGTRPEAIKMAPVVKAIEASKDLESVVCVTAQHRSMLDQVLEVFHITPDYDLNIMQKNQTLSHITGAVINGIEEIIIKEKPDVVLVHGDTTTGMAASLAAFYQQVKIGHVEAGLRTYDKYSPYPEEINRQIIDRVSDFLFAPTEVSAQNIRESHLNKGQQIVVTGNTAIDALKSTVSDKYQHQELDWVRGSRLILVTAHRRENLGQPMERIFSAIRQIADEFADVKIIYPVHLNPKVRETAKRILGDHERIHLVEPLDVLDFHNFIHESYFIMSDSGGVQEEAPSLGKPVLVLRDTTERPEGVAAGTLKLIGTETADIYAAAKELLIDQDVYSSMAKAKNPYGDGHASERIIKHLIENV